MAEGLVRRLVAEPSPALTTKLELFLSRPWFSPSAMLVNRQLVYVPLVGIFKPISLFQFKWHA